MRNAHSGCSETFYRKELESEARSSPSKTQEERHKMMELLKHFEEDSMDDSVLGDAAEYEEDKSDLACRIASLDVGSASYDQLWTALSPAQRGRFLKALNDPSSELIQQLLASDELENERTEPWWEAHMERSDDDKLSAKISTRARGPKPDIMPIPAAMINVSSSPPVARGPRLLYNICAVCIAYAFVTRSLSTSPLSSISPHEPEHEEARRSIAQLVPFLTERKSQVVHPTLSSVVTDLWSRFEPGRMTQPVFSLLLRDAAILLRPVAVTVLSPASPSLSRPSHSKHDTSNDQNYQDLEAHPSTNALRVLSDLFGLFTSMARPSSSTPPANLHQSTTRTEMNRNLSPQRNHVTHKLSFYAVHILGVPSVLLHALAEEVAARADALESEDTRVMQEALALPNTSATQGPWRSISELVTRDVRRAPIEELDR
ncbi:hypothetical protein AcW2_005734 [Taiwanofungus camphoratus]|nr:hypothetical protein AcW2_005734 [Antrodia cinnamomea]